MKGLVHIYTGNGKGKTSAAIGLGVRAYGRGLRVLMVQFLKGGATGEIETFKLLGPRFMLKRGKEIKKFTWKMTSEELNETRKGEQQTFDFARQAIESGEWDVLILDEAMGALATGMIDLKDIIDLINNKPEGLELVLTGRNAPKELVDLADYVSEINAVKHPMEKGIPAREGIES